MSDALPRRTRIWLTVVAAGGLCMLLVIAALAAGIDLPGPNLRDRLGLTSTDYSPCDVRERNLKAPPGAAAPVQPSWRLEPPLPSRRDEVKAILVGDRIWVMNGATPADDTIASLADVLAFDPARGSYERMPEVPEPLDHVAAGAHGGDVVVAGGYQATEAIDKAWRFFAAEARWRPIAPLDQPRAAAGSAVLDGRLYVVGGTALSSFDEDIFERTPQASLQIYDFRSGRWSEGAPMPTPRHHLALAAHEGRLYAIGGRMAGDFSADAVERYDPATDRWERLGRMPLGAGGVAAETAGSRIVVAGGGDDRERWVTPAAWAYYPREDRWSRLADLREPRHGHSLAVAAGRAYVFGGAPCSGFGLARTVESLDVRDAGRR